MNWRSDAGLELTYVADAGAGDRRRILVRPRSDGRYDLLEGRHNGCTWVPEGHAIVADMTVDGALPGTAALTRGP